jgi:hypothetical protein
LASDLPRSQKTSTAANQEDAPDGQEAHHEAALGSGEGQNRTGDTTIFSRVLYQLSYLAGRRKG